MRAEPTVAYARQNGMAGAHPRTHVPRLHLVEEVEEGLRREGIVVLKAPWGYGKTTLLHDCARHSREVSSCPIVHVDFNSPEAMAYMSGSDGELGRILSAQACGSSRADAAEGGQDPDPADGDCSKRRKRRGAGSVRVPSRYAQRASRVVWLHLHWMAGQWSRLLESSFQNAHEPTADGPLVLIDDLPKLDAPSAADFARAVRFWSSRGARIVITCLPSSGIDQQSLSQALFLGPDMLGVCSQEMGMWVRWLSIARDLDVEGLTNGVPMLVAACARIRAGDGRSDGGFLRACELVMGHALAEPLTSSVGLARRAMMVLGCGRLSEMARVGACVNAWEIEELALSFPMLGIDLERGTFRCPPLAPSLGYSCVRMCVEDNERLGARLVERLLDREEAQRAGAVLGFLPPTERARLLEAHPERFADVLAPDMVLETFDAAGERGYVAGKGAAQLRSFVEVCQDGKLGGHPDGFVSDIACVLSFWRRFAGFAYAGQVGAGLADIVAELGEAGLVGDAGRWSDALARLDGALAGRPAETEGLGATVLRCHAAACGVLAGRASQARSWLAPFAQRKRVLRSAQRCPSGVSDALLTACLVLASHTEELPSAGGSVATGLDAVRNAKRYLEDRQVGFGVALCSLVEAILLIAMGDEARADGFADLLLRRWSQQGCGLGQVFSRLLKAHCALAQNRPSQARGHAAVAFGVSQGMRFPRLEGLSRLYLVASLIRCRDRCEIGEHELEVSAQASASRGREEASLLLAQALFAVSEGELDCARDRLEALARRAAPMQMRLAAFLARSLGHDRSAFLECMPNELLREYNAIREAKRRPSYGSLGEGATTAAGFVGLPDSDRGLYINVFGVMGGMLNGRPLTLRDWGRTKGLHLACLLALAPSSRMQRDDLADILFSSSIRSKRRSALGTTLNCLRTSLGQGCGGPDYIVGSMGTLSLNPLLVESDVSKFECAATQLMARRDEMTLREVVDDCDALVRLYGAGPDERLARLGDLVSRRVEQLRNLFVDCMLVAVDACYARGEFETALGFASHASLAAPDRRDVAAAHDLALRAKARKGAAQDAPLRAPSVPSVAYRRRTSDASHAGGASPQAPGVSGRPEGSEVHVQAGGADEPGRAIGPDGSQAKALPVVGALLSGPTTACVQSGGPAPLCDAPTAPVDPEDVQNPARPIVGVC